MRSWGPPTGAIAVAVVVVPLPIVVTVGCRNMHIEYTVHCSRCGYERTVDTESTAEDLQQKHTLTSARCSYRYMKIKSEYEGIYEV